MSYIWTFSPECNSMVERCLSAAGPPDPSNKWIQKFGPKNLEIIKTEKTIIIDDSPEIDESLPEQEDQDEDLLKAEEEFLDPDIDLLSKFDYFVKNCLKYPKLLTKLAQNLPTKAVEKLFQRILDTENSKKDFLFIFYKYFVYTYVKRDNSRTSANFLFKSYKKYPQYLKIALKRILKDLNIETNVLNDFISKLNVAEQTDILNIMSNLEFTADEFCHNLFNIYTAYESCDKTDIIQNYIFSCIQNYAEICNANKNFGKLMLAFLKQEHYLQRDRVSNVMDELLEKHKSPFKRPCMSILKQIKEFSH